MSLLGQYDHIINAKGRMNFPAKLLAELGDKFIVTLGIDGCLVVYSNSEWAKLEEAISRHSLSAAPDRNLNRWFFGSAAEVETDAQGRILIPQKLREFAGLEKDVLVIGCSTYAEIWSKERYEASMDGADITAKLEEAVNERLKQGNGEI